MNVMSDNLQIFSYNVNGLGLPVKTYRVIKTIQKLEVDVLLLQETHQNKNKKEIIKHPMLGEQYIANGTNKAREMAIIFMKNSKFEVI